MKSLMKIIAACSLIGIMSCGKFLDVVPNDTPTLSSAFSNRSVMEKFLRTCYSSLPDPTNSLYYPAYFTSKDEFDWRGETRFGNSRQRYWRGRQVPCSMGTLIMRAGLITVEST